jgi:hypothetical protein
MPPISDVMIADIIYDSSDFIICLLNTEYAHAIFSIFAIAVTLTIMIATPRLAFRHGARHFVR